MTYAYRCDKCGRFQDGRPGAQTCISWWQSNEEDEERDYQHIDLCPVCAPALLDPLAAIAATKHEAPEAPDEPYGSEMILSMGETRTGDEHTDADDAAWLSESDS